jgi:DNA-directed RNA polymerase subunit RPC12/RpoP
MKCSRCKTLNETWRYNCVKCGGRLRQVQDGR